MALTASNQQIGQWGPTQIDADIRIFPNGPPPGILMDIQVPGPPVHFSSGKSRDDIVITAIPEVWDINHWPNWEWEGCPSWDTEIIYEMMDEIEGDIESEHQEKLTQIDNELVWMDLCRDDDESYFFIDEGQFDSFYSGQSVKESNVADDEYESCMSQFEQDFDYEQSLILEQKGNDEINLHRLLACPFDKRPGWCGEVGEEPQRVFWGGVAQVCGNGDWTYRKERYKWPVEIIRLHPENKSNGYAVGKTPYGKVYFPEKFRGYLPEVGSSITTTVALQDVGRSNKKGNAFRFTAIYTH